MDTLGVLVVVGTRPEAIKLLSVIRALRDSEHFHPIVISTGQHRELVRDVLGLVGVEPSTELSVGRPGIGLNEVFVEVVAGLDALAHDRAAGVGPLETAPNERRLVGPRAYPAACLVHGDTTSAVAAALAAFHLRIPVAHIEAGLRTHSVTPFPEELNRQLIARIAAFHLAPTVSSEQNLVLEGVQEDQIFVTGNTGIDTVMWASGLEMPYADPVLDGLNPDTRVVVVTAHRRENWGDRLAQIADAVVRIAAAHPSTLFVWPVHPNPAVADTVRPRVAGSTNVHVTAPMPYIPFARLLRRACLVITDSGGLQEEAPALGTPVLVTRDSTERSEGVAAGTLKLVGTNADRIWAEANTLLTDEAARQAMARLPSPYGDGLAAARIVDAFTHIALDTPAPQPFGAGFRRTAVIAAAGYRIGQLSADSP
jgi:UDP-N-acetylglucosamine 2-epimerase (non-hydrolysing)